MNDSIHEQNYALVRYGVPGTRYQVLIFDFYMKRTQNYYIRVDVSHVQVGTYLTGTQQSRVGIAQQLLETQLKRLKVNMSGTYVGYS